MSKKRGQGEGSIFEESPGKWRASVSLGWRNGQRIRKTFTAATRGEVKDKLTKALRDHQLGLPVKVEKQTVSQFLESWLSNVAKQRVRPSTLTSYGWIIRRHIGPGLGRVQLARLAPQQVQQFLNEKLNYISCPVCEDRIAARDFDAHVAARHAETKQTIHNPSLSPRTVQHIHATLRAALEQARKWELVGRNVATLVEAPRVVRHQIQPYTPEQARAFLDAMKGDRLEALYSVAIAIGLRQGEALGLRWQDIDFAAGRLTVTNSLQRVDGKLQLVETKRDRSRRTITLPQVCMNALLAHLARQDGERTWAGDRWKETGFVFTTTVGTPIDGPACTHRFQKTLGKANLPRMRFHDLRHTCATLLLAQGVHPRLVMEILGHSQIAVTMNTYSHVIPAMQREVANQMDAILNPPAVPVATSVATSQASAKPN